MFSFGSARVNVTLDVGSKQQALDIIQSLRDKPLYEGMEMNDDTIKIND